jgi:hypothetical protein
MFDEPKTSLSQLDDVEREWMLRFLKGTPWDDLFETLEDGSMAPSWLVEWSSSWGTDTVLTLEEIDPYGSDAWLVTDSSNGECWLTVEECGETIAVFERVPAADGIHGNEAVGEIALNYLRSIGDFPVLGRLQVNPMWLPLSPMRSYLEGAMQTAGQTFLQGDANLTLEQWLKREYQKDH